MITRYGMSEDFDMVALETVHEPVSWAGIPLWPVLRIRQAEIDKLVVALVKREHEKAYRILEENRAKLDELAQYLYEKETITGEEFMAILNQK